MGQTDKLFNGFLRMLIGNLREALTEDDPAKLREKIELLLADLQTTLED